MNSRVIFYTISASSSFFQTFNKAMRTRCRDVELLIRFGLNEVFV